MTADVTCFQSVEGSLPSLVETLYEVASGWGKWTTFLNALCACTRSDTAMLVAADADEEIVFFEQVGYDTSPEISYESFFLLSNMGCGRLQDARDESFDGAALTASPLIEGGARQGEYYDAFIRPRDLFEKGGGVLESVPGYAASGLSLLRPQGGAFTAETLGLLKRLSPHLRKAMLIHAELARARTERKTVAQLGLSMDLAYAIVEPQMRVKVMSEAAEKILRRGEGVQLLQGKIVANKANEDADLRALVMAQASDAFGLRYTEVSSSVLLSRQLPLTPLRMMATAIVPHETVRAFSRVQVILFFLDGQRAHLSRSDALRRGYKLMPSEARMADRLLQGDDIKQVAERLRITENSARHMLKEIFRKTGVHCQSSLLRLLMCLPAASPIVETNRVHSSS